jgi:hypothetical protein
MITVALLLLMAQPGWRPNAMGTCFGAVLGPMPSDFCDPHTEVQLKNRPLLVSE